MSEAQAAVQTDDSHAQSAGVQPAVAASGGAEAATGDAPSSWAFVGISPEARRAAEMAAEASGMEVDIWLSQLIKYKSAMELRGREAVSLDDAIFQMAPKSDETATASAERTQTPAAAATPPANDSNAEKSVEDAETVPPVSGDETLVLNTKADGGPVRTTPMGGHVTATQAGRDAAGSSAMAPQQQAAAPAAPQQNTGAQPASIQAAGTPVSRTPAAATPTNGLHDGLADDAPRRQMMPTDALRASRLSAIGKANEIEIQHVLDNWRDARSLEPLVVRPVAGERNAFEVIAGVERWYAARRAHVREVPVILHEASDDEAIRLAMSMRLKRGPMSPLAEANTYLSLMSEAHMSTEQVARLVGKPPAHIATMVRVLNLPRSVRQMLERGEITALHARALLDAPNPDASAREVIARRLDIYQTEQLVRATAVRSARAEKVNIADVELDVAHESDIATADLADDHNAEIGKVETGPETQEQEFADEPGGGDFVGEAGEDGLTILDDDDFGAALLDDAGIDDTEFRAANDTFGPTDEQPAQQETESHPEGQPEGHGEDTVSTELMERRLAAKLGVKVAITERHSVGVISLHYSSREELSDIVARLNTDPDH